MPAFCSAFGHTTTQKVLASLRGWNDEEHTYVQEESADDGLVLRVRLTDPHGLLLENAIMTGVLSDLEEVMEYWGVGREGGVA